MKGTNSLRQTPNFLDIVVQANPPHLVSDDLRGPAYNRNTILDARILVVWKPAVLKHCSGCRKVSLSYLLHLLWVVGEQVHPLGYLLRLAKRLVPTRNLKACPWGHFSLAPFAVLFQFLLQGCVAPFWLSESRHKAAGVLIFPYASTKRQLRLSCSGGSGGALSKT